VNSVCIWSDILSSKMKGPAVTLHRVLTVAGTVDSAISTSLRVLHLKVVKSFGPEESPPSNRVPGGSWASAGLTTSGKAAR
ncbi:MAG TPA: hypothetical protein VLL08_26265, partial [Kineosporiaceae bacterium]|nr:hypothetical protein [Kineosporiaceae bacterium]